MRSRWRRALIRGVFGARVCQSAPSAVVAHPRLFATPSVLIAQEPANATLGNRAEARSYELLPFEVRLQVHSLEADSRCAMYYQKNVAGIRTRRTMWDAPRSRLPLASHAPNAKRTNIVKKENHITRCCVLSAKEGGRRRTESAPAQSIQDTALPIEAL